MSRGLGGNADGTLAAGQRALRGLYAITPDWQDTRRLCDAVGEAILGGAAAIQYRNKKAPPELAWRQAEALANLCKPAGIPLIINDDAELAIALRADGVHLGMADAALSQIGTVKARLEQAGSAAIVGISCYSELARARAAETAGADYVAFGSFFASLTKPAASRASVDLLNRARAALQVPLVAIGGITTVNASCLIEAGADAIAVISDLFERADIRRQAQLFKEMFNEVVQQ
ncbi:MAG TPA: thiamine phosphate synthase [Usitatibacteraceae bacterium]|nr:thiamine phosphate synthase [Usitatibacteraceae bacterium]